MLDTTTRTCLDTTTTRTCFLYNITIYAGAE
jgi:hypothetical protein